MDIVVEVAMECQKHQVDLDNNKGGDMVVTVTMECHKLQIGLNSNKDMDMVERA